MISTQLPMAFHLQMEGDAKCDIIVIDPIDETVRIHEVTGGNRSIRKILKGSIDKIHKLPNGDLVFKERYPSSTKWFSMGGSSPIQGRAVIVRKCKAATLAKLHSSIEMVRHLVNF